MLSTARKYVGIYQAEEDVVHNAILKIIDNLNKVDISNTVKSRNYVCIITKSCAIDWLRNHRYDNSVDIDTIEYDLDSESPSPLDQVLSKDGYEKLIKCIRSLNDTHRMVCELKFLHNMKEREIADLLGLTP
ncbi:MAG: sigma-70 family RNA polymerase sigma factor [Clostridia bacterium]|nr:sigma-70 family RNA polymerase sigma factor [Clostridia bacterium]